MDDDRFPLESKFVCTWRVMWSETAIFVVGFIAAGLGTSRSETHLLILCAPHNGSNSGLPHIGRDTELLIHNSPF